MFSIEAETTYNLLRHAKLEEQKAIIRASHVKNLKELIDYIQSERTGEVHQHGFIAQAWMDFCSKSKDSQSPIEGNYAAFLRLLLNATSADTQKRIMRGTPLQQLRNLEEYLEYNRRWFFWRFFFPIMPYEPKLHLIITERHQAGGGGGRGGQGRGGRGGGNPDKNRKRRVTCVSCSMKFNTTYSGPTPKCRACFKR